MDMLLLIVTFVSVRVIIANCLFLNIDCDQTRNVVIYWPIWVSSTWPQHILGTPVRWPGTLQKSSQVPSGNQTWLAGNPIEGLVGKINIPSHLHQPSSTIISHHPPSCISITHYLSVINHHQSMTNPLLTIINHYWPLATIINPL